MRANAQLRWATAPDPHEVANRAIPTTALWERRPHDSDFLSLRFGWGETPTEVGYEVGEGGDPGLTKETRKRLDPLLISGSSPLVVDLREVDHIGVVTEAAMALTLQTWPMFQLSVLNSPREVLLAAVVPDRAEWGWLARLPHAQWRERGAVAAGRVEARELVREVGAIVEERAAQGRSRMGGDQRHGQLPALVMLVDDTVELPRNLVTTLLEEGPAVGVHLLWFTDSRAGVPGHCGVVLKTSGTLTDATWTRTGALILGASLDHVRPQTVDEASWLLTGLRDASSRDRRAEVPSQVSLVDTLGMTMPTADLITERWSRSTGLGAPLGVGVEGTIDVDLRHDGPHALLGGTTGAGKSELLQTLVGSLAATNPPDRPHLPACRLQGRGGVQGLCSAAAHRGHGHRPGRPPRLQGSGVTDCRAEPPRAHTGFCRSQGPDRYATQGARSRPAVAVARRGRVRRPRDRAARVR